MLKSGVFVLFAMLCMASTVAFETNNCVGRGAMAVYEIRGGAAAAKTPVVAKGKDTKKKDDKKGKKDDKKVDTKKKAITTRGGGALGKAPTPPAKGKDAKKGGKEGKKDDKKKTDTNKKAVVEDMKTKVMSWTGGGFGGKATTIPAKDKDAKKDDKKGKKDDKKKTDINKKAVIEGCSAGKCKRVMKTRGGGFGGKAPAAPAAKGKDAKKVDKKGKKDDKKKTDTKKKAVVEDMKTKVMSLTGGAFGGKAPAAPVKGKVAEKDGKTKGKKGDKKKTDTKKGK